MDMGVTGGVGGGEVKFVSIVLQQRNAFTTTMNVTREPYVLNRLSGVV